MGATIELNILVIRLKKSRLLGRGVKLIIAVWSGKGLNIHKIDFKAVSVCSHVRIYVLYYVSRPDRYNRAGGSMIDSRAKRPLVVHKLRVWAIGFSAFSLGSQLLQ